MSPKSVKITVHGPVYSPSFTNTMPFHAHCGLNKQPFMVFPTNHSSP